MLRDDDEEQVETERRGKPGIPAPNGACDWSGVRLFGIMFQHWYQFSMPGEQMLIYPSVYRAISGLSEYT